MVWKPGKMGIFHGELLVCRRVDDVVFLKTQVWVGSSSSIDFSRLVVSNVFFVLKLWWWNHPGWWYRGILALRGEVFKEKRSPSFWVLKSLITHFSGDTYNASNSEGSPSTTAHYWTCFLTMIDCPEPNWPLFLQVKGGGMFISLEPAIFVRNLRWHCATYHVSYHS